MVSLLRPLAWATPAHTTTSWCRHIPGDAGWPSESDWSQLNATVHGRLIATVPQASICHSAPYDSLDDAACRALRERWDFPETLYVTAERIPGGPGISERPCSKS